MKLSISELKPVALEWIDKVVMPRSSPLQVFAISFALGQMNGQLDGYMERAKVFADSDGYINLPEVATNARAALKKAGGHITIPYLNWVFDADDLEMLLSIAKEHAHE